MRLVTVVAVACALVFVVGCLSAAHQARIEELTKENQRLADDMKALVEKGKAGTLTTGEIAEAVQKINEQMKRNIEEIRVIQAEGGTTAGVIGGIIGMVGRTALHAVAASIPGAGPLSAGLQAILTLLLGGSQSVKKQEAPLPKTTT